MLEIPTRAGLSDLSSPEMVPMGTRIPNTEGDDLSVLWTSAGRCGSPWSHTAPGHLQCGLSTLRCAASVKHMPEFTDIHPQNLELLNNLILITY